MSKFLEGLLKAAKENPELAAKLKRAEEMGFDTSKVWYHGTPNTEFKEFDPNFKHTGSGSTAEGYGIYFAQDPELANNYAAKEGRVIPVFLKKGNYLNVNQPPKVTDQDVKKIEKIFKSANDYENLIINYGDENPKKAQQIANYYIKNNESLVDALHEPANSMYQGNLEGWAKALTEQGYTGFEGALQAGQSPIKVVPDPENIKSVFAEFKDKKGLMGGFAPITAAGVEINPVNKLKELYDSYKESQREVSEPMANYLASQLDLGSKVGAPGMSSEVVKTGVTEATDPLNYTTAGDIAIMVDLLGKRKGK